MEPWIIRSKIRPQARVRLIGFPFPGGSATVFEKWHQYFPETVEVCAVQLPGRQKRIFESPLTCAKSAVDLLADFLQPHCDCPVAVFGDCAAAFLAFELCQRLLNGTGFHLAHLFVTSCRAPSLPNRQANIYNLPDSELKQEMVKLGVVPAWLQENDAVFSAFLPLIRADFEMVETYQMTKTNVLACPVTAISGNADPTCSVEELAAWKHHTNGSFRMEVLDAQHNITASHLDAITNIVAEDLHPLLNSA